MEYERVADEVAAPHQRSCAPLGGCHIVAPAAGVSLVSQITVWHAGSKFTAVQLLGSCLRPVGADTLLCPGCRAGRGLRHAAEPQHACFGAGALLRRGSMCGADRNRLQCWEQAPDVSGYFQGAGASSRLYAQQGLRHHIVPCCFRPHPFCNRAGHHAGCPDAPCLGQRRDAALVGAARHQAAARGRTSQARRGCLSASFDER